MADFMDVIKGRRAVRKFEDKEIPEDMLNQVLEAVQWSPSWANTQVWEIIVVKDPVTKENLSQKLSPKNPSTRAVANAPVVLAVCGKLKTSGYFNDQAITTLGDWFMFDLGLATQSLCLAAHGLGLGTVIIGAFDVIGAEEILGVPEGYSLVTILPLGYPNQDPPPPKRREVNEFVHRDRF